MYGLSVLRSLKVCDFVKGVLFGSVGAYLASSTVFVKLLKRRSLL